MAEKDITVLVGKRVMEIRVEKGFTQIHLSALSQIEQANLARIESGRANPTIKTLAKLANALEVDPIEFFK